MVVYKWNVFMQKPNFLPFVLANNAAAKTDKKR